MKVIPDFELELQTIDRDISVTPHPVNTEMAAVTWKGIDICACPSNQIYDERTSTYTNSVGLPHRSRPEVVAKVHQFLDEMKDPEFRKLMNDKDLIK